MGDDLFFNSVHDHVWNRFAIEEMRGYIDIGILIYLGGEYTV